VVVAGKGEEPGLTFRGAGVNGYSHN